MLEHKIVKKWKDLCVEAPRPASAPETYPTLATFVRRLIKTYSVKYYITDNMFCINFFRQFLPFPIVIPSKHVLTIDTVSYTHLTLPTKRIV